MQKVPISGAGGQLVRHVCLQTKTGMRSLSGRAYQYLEESSLRTDKFQKSLPRLPIPKLDKSCERYLAALEPVARDAASLETTKREVERFRLGLGVEFHEDLIKLDKRYKQTSYISAPWFDMYLSSRSPLPLNYNPFLAWKMDPNPAQNDQLIRATNMVISALRFRRSFAENKLSPEVFHLNPKKSNTPTYKSVMKMVPDAIAFYASAAFKAFPLDMSQYDSLFDSTRIPVRDKDILRKSHKPRHIVVLRAGHFFSVPVLDASGDILEPAAILSSLAHIKNLKLEPILSPAVFTTQDRNAWASNRERLVTLSTDNQQALEKIDSAIFVLAMDDKQFNPDPEKVESQVEAAHNFLHGCPRPGETGRAPIVNRWFDKSFSILITGDGLPAVNFEHSWGDGVAVLRFFNEVQQDSVKNSFVTPETATDKLPSGDLAPQEITFKLDDQLQERAKQAYADYVATTSRLDLNPLIYSDRMNRSYFKAKKLSPDSMFQLAFQMAYFRLYGHTPVSYESCSTAAFKHGRTETVRPATRATKRAVEAILNPKGASGSDLRGLLDACSKIHYNLCKEASMGQGFDRHLFVLRQLAERKGKLSAIFEDPNYAFSNHFTLSTSTLYGENFTGGGFAPVVQDGFGLGYGYIEDNLGVFCSSFSPARDGRQMRDAIEKSLDDLYNVCERK